MGWLEGGKGFGEWWICTIFVLSNYKTSTCRDKRTNTMKNCQMHFTKCVKDDLQIYDKMLSHFSDSNN